MGGYLPENQAGRRAMLDALGAGSVDQLFAAIPDGLRVEQLALGEPLSELALRRRMETMAGQNHVFASCFRGGGAYRHYVPAVVKQVAAKETFLTGYTPYQAEISQGVLQAIFEFQSEVCMLSGMEVANASVYDGASAAAEAVKMCLERNRQTAVLAETLQPDVQAVVGTYARSADIPLRSLPQRGGRVDLDALPGLLDAGTACVVVQSPNANGLLEDVAGIAALCHEAGVRLVLSYNPIAAAWLKTPGELGADIAVAEGQPLGLPLSFGGPYLGLMSCRKELMRRLPGRIVGQTQDADGRRCYVLTLQAREQHIRREKAGSSICSNEALCAMTAGAYLAAMGPEGLREAARQCYAKAHYAAAALAQAGYARLHEGAFFHEFATRCPAPPEAVLARLEREDILGGLPVEGGILWCCTELNSRAEIDRMVAVCREVAEG